MIDFAYLETLHLHCEAYYGLLWIEANTSLKRLTNLTLRGEFLLKVKFNFRSYSDASTSVLKELSLLQEHWSYRFASTGGASEPRSFDMARLSGA